MLVLFGHPSNSSPSNCTAGLFPATTGLTNGGVPAIYAIGTGMEYGHHQGGVMPHHFVTNQTPIIDVSSKLGAPLKQTSTLKHNSNSMSGSTASPRRAQPMAYNTRYKTQRCHSYSETGYCNYKEKCQFAHGDAELRQVPRHPKRKTELCRNFHSTGLCNYGERCDFIHNEVPVSLASPPQPQSPTLWQAAAINNRLMTNSAGWNSPSVPVGGPSSTSFRRSTPITPAAAVAPLTIPALTEVIGAPGLPYIYHHHQPSSICALGSVCSSSQSCASGADSPPPSSSSCDQSPVSFSPDLVTNGSSYEHFYYTPPQQQSPMAAFQTQHQAMINGIGDDLLAPKYGPPTSDIGTAPTSAAAGRRRGFTYSTDSTTTTADGAESNASTQYSDMDLMFPTNPHQTSDLGQLWANLCRLGLLDSNAGNLDDETIAAPVFDPAFGQDKEQQLMIGDFSSMTGKSGTDQSTLITDRRLPTFTLLTQGDHRRETETGDDYFGGQSTATWVSNERKCVF